MRHLLFALFLSLLLTSRLYAATVTQTQSGTLDTWASGSSTASNAQVLSSAVTLTNPGHLYAYCTFNVTAVSGTVTANTAATVWFLVSTDAGSTYPDGDASIQPPTPPSLTFPLRAVNTAQTVGLRVDRMPLGSFKVLVRNDATGVTFTSWTLKCRTHTLSIN